MGQRSMDIPSGKEIEVVWFVSGHPGSFFQIERPTTSKTDAAFFVIWSRVDVNYMI